MVNRLTIRKIAVDADADERTVEKEIRRARGEPLPPVRGRAGERVREAMARHGVQPAGDSGGRAA
jgi:hypothetical protein